MILDYTQNSRERRTIQKTHCAISKNHEVQLWETSLLGPSGGVIFCVHRIHDRAHEEFLGNYLFHYFKKRSFVWYIGLKIVLDGPKNRSCLWRAIKNNFWVYQERFVVFC